MSQHNLYFRYSHTETNYSLSLLYLYFLCVCVSGSLSKSCKALDFSQVWSKWCQPFHFLDLERVLALRCGAGGRTVVGAVRWGGLWGGHGGVPPSLTRIGDRYRTGVGAGKSASVLLEVDIPPLNTRSDGPLPRPRERHQPQQHLQTS